MTDRVTVTEPKLVDICPAFRNKMQEYARLVAAGRQRGADKVFREAQVIAKEFRKGQAK